MPDSASSHPGSSKELRMENSHGSNNETTENKKSKTLKAMFLVLMNCVLMTIGQVGGPLLLRIYYLHGGKRKWLNAWLLTSGFPILILPIAFSYLRAQAKGQATGLLVTPKLVAASAILGLLLGLDGYLYSFGLSYLPISVSSLLGSTQLAFTAIFALVVVRHKFTHYSVNAVVLMTFGSVVLGLHMNGDRPSGVSEKAGMPITFDLVMQIQFLISMFATLFCTIPMIINKDFQVLEITCI